MRPNLIYKSICALTAMKALIKEGYWTGAMEHYVKNNPDISPNKQRAMASEGFAKLCYSIADAMDAEGKARHNAEKKEGEK